MLHTRRLKNYDSLRNNKKETSFKLVTIIYHSLIHRLMSINIMDNYPITNPYDNKLKCAQYSLAATLYNIANVHAEGSLRCPFLKRLLLTKAINKRQILNG